MSKTTYFELNKPALTDGLEVGELNDNMDIIDTEMHKPPLTVNDTSPDASRNIQIDTVPLADNLTADQAQVSNGTFVVRTSGGSASIKSGSAFLSQITGNMVKEGYAAQVCTIEVTNATRPDPDTEEIDATVNADDFRDAVENTNDDYLFIYSTVWTLNSATVDIDDYGITVTGTPYAGDTITVHFVAENRGYIYTATPEKFISTGWNLYNHTAGTARVCRYSEEYGYKIAGDYLILEFASTLNGQKTEITPVMGSFNVPGDGWLFVSGGNSTNTEIWAEWTDWGEEPNGGVFAAYSQTVVDISGIMVNFPDGLMKVGSVADEINLNTGIAYSRIEKLDYETYIGQIIASGRPYDTDTDYVYAVRENAVPYDVSSVSGTYTASDHGIEYYTDTEVAVGSQVFYGQDLKDKLRRDVLTISPQELTPSQKTNVMNYIGVTDAITAAKKSITDTYDDVFLKRLYSYSYTDLAANGTLSISAEDFGIEAISGYIMIGIYYMTTGTVNCFINAAIATSSGTAMTIKNSSSNAQSKTAKLGILWVKSRMV